MTDPELARARKAVMEAEIDALDIERNILGQALQDITEVRGSNVANRMHLIAVHALAKVARDE